MLYIKCHCLIIYINILSKTHFIKLNYFIYKSIQITNVIEKKLCDIGRRKE